MQQKSSKSNFGKIMTVFIIFTLVIVLTSFGWGEYNRYYVQQLIEDVENESFLQLGSSSIDDVIEFWWCPLTMLVE